MMGRKYGVTKKTVTTVLDGCESVTCARQVFCSTLIPRPSNSNSNGSNNANSSNNSNGINSNSNNSNSSSSYNSYNIRCLCFWRRSQATNFLSIAGLVL